MTGSDDNELNTVNARRDERRRPTDHHWSRRIRIPEEGWRFKLFRVLLIVSIIVLGAWSASVIERGFEPLRREAQLDREMMSLERLDRSFRDRVYDPAIFSEVAARDAELDAWLVENEKALAGVQIVIENVLIEIDDQVRPLQDLRRLESALAQRRIEIATDLRVQRQALASAWRNVAIVAIVLLLQALAALFLLDLNVRARRRISVLFRRATRDELTGVLNRRAIEARAQRELERSRREGNELAILLVDLDFFKLINDELGHRAGDRFLVEASKRFHESLRPYDAVGRYGGDEFLIILPGCDVESAEVVCRRIRDAMHRPLALGRQERAGSVSIGAVVVMPGAAELDELIEMADRALYQTKESGRDGWTTLTHIPDVGVPATGESDLPLLDELEPLEGPESST